MVCDGPVFSASGVELAPTERVLSAGWRMAVTEPDSFKDKLPDTAALDWVPADVPGTAAAALTAAGRFDPAHPDPLHGKDIWYTTEFSVAESGPRRLVFAGLATIAEVYLNGERILDSENMFLAQEADVSVRDKNRLAICFRSLAPRLDQKGPRARWRPQLATSQGLRLVRTTLLGHMPGWCPEIHAVGPWRPVTLHRPDAPRLSDLRIKTGLDADGTGFLHVSARIQGSEIAPILRYAGRKADLKPQGDGRHAAELALPGIVPWMPHTHGTPQLYDLHLDWQGDVYGLARVGFRRIEIDRGPDGKGFGLVVNGTPVFCRGAVWTTADLLGLSGSAETYAPLLKRARDAGMNMLRIGGTMTYETRAFYELCSELGILVWQDFQFANYDYPVKDAGFVQTLTAEARHQLNLLQGQPALGVLCGGSEIYQQGAMMGLPESRWKGPLTTEILAGVSADLRPDVPYVENAPCGGALPFSPNEGVAHYYGVGAYLRPLEDARRADVRFAAECLAFSHVPDNETLESHVSGNPGHDPRWKAAIPRDRGAGWDFEDVRDYYLKTLFGLDPLALRYGDPDRYLDVSRAVTSDILEATYAEWRRAGSSCLGALVWTFQDVMPGAGWGVIDSLGRPKPAYYALKRAFRPVQVALTDEGTNGLSVHVSNETATPRNLGLSLTCLRAGAVPVVSGNKDLELAPGQHVDISATDLFGAFFDTTYAYRFGPPAHDVTVARLADVESGDIVADTYHFPQGFSDAQHPLELATHLEEDAPGSWVLTLSAERTYRFVQIDAPGFLSSDNGFTLAPGAPCRIRLTPADTPGAESARPSPLCRIRALNGANTVSVS
ncbi:MAG: glycoside hydrolase family 2 protein [Roseibium sp.]|nr:glycoside hydrolase family 2 protein [Roseibium sp.]